MAYPSTHKLTVVHVSAHSPSIGASPVAVPARAVPLQRRKAHGGGKRLDHHGRLLDRGRAQWRCDLGQPLHVPGGAGQVASMTPTAKTYANEDDTISFTPSGASGANIAGNFTAVLKQA